MLRVKVNLMRARCVRDIGFPQVRDRVGAAEHAAGSDVCVDLVAVYAEAGASEHGLSSGDWCLHRNRG